MQSNNNNHIQNHNARTNNNNDWHSSNLWQRSAAPTSIENILSSSPSLPTLPPVQSRSPSRYTSTTNHLYQPYSTLSRSSSTSLLSNNSRTKPPTRPRLTTTLWEDESTLCYQVDSRGICVARRQDNNMINGTKLLNVAGMSRGKRDGILKNERGRIVVKVGAMHLKGVWIPFVRAKALASQFKIYDILHPIFSDNPASFLYPSHFHQMNHINRFNNSPSSSPSSTTTHTLQPYSSASNTADVSHNSVIYGMYHHQPQSSNYSQDHHYLTDTYTATSVQKRPVPTDDTDHSNLTARTEYNASAQPPYYPSSSSSSNKHYFNHDQASTDTTKLSTTTKLPSTDKSFW